MKLCNRMQQKTYQKAVEEGIDKHYNRRVFPGSQGTLE
jgi:hypothetical protein